MFLRKEEKKSLLGEIFLSEDNINNQAELLSHGGKYRLKLSAEFVQGKCLRIY